MATIKQPYVHIELTGSSIVLKRADGKDDIIPIAALEALSLMGTITDASGDQTFFDDFDPDNVQPPTIITDIAKNWKVNYVDFGVARIAMSDEIENRKGFKSLSDFEKRIAARWFVASSDDRLSVITVDEDKDNWFFLLEHTKPTRDQRIEVARRKISYELLPQEASDLYLSVNNYISSFSIANMPDLIQWIGNERGSVYELAGFMQKPYFSAARRDMLLDVLRDGIYTL